MEHLEQLLMEIKSENYLKILLDKKAKLEALIAEAQKSIDQINDILSGKHAAKKMEPMAKPAKQPGRKPAKQTKPKTNPRIINTSGKSYRTMLLEVLEDGKVLTPQEISEAIVKKFKTNKDKTENNVSTVLVTLLRNQILTRKEIEGKSRYAMK